MFAFKSTPRAFASASSKPAPKPASSASPGSLPYRKGTNHKTYTGPDPASLPKRTKAESEAFFEQQKRAGKGNLWSPKVDRRLRYGSAVTCVVAVVFMTLFVDYGEKEHVFTPIRQEFDRMRRSFTTLSPEERRTVGSEQQTTGVVPGSERAEETLSEWKPC
ncbi:hypothetical protein IAT38_006513 [Cryptococcus sp. DSM 104549]